jgi:hypothetical protein
MTQGDGSLPIEQFIQALTSQLDRAQTAMAVKAHNMNLPLTFAVRDLSIDLRTHVDVVKSEVHIRPAGPGDKEASTIHLTLTTITKPMIDENARPLQFDPDEPSLKDAVGDDLTDEEQRRLEWAGVQSVSQLKKLKETGGDRAIERVANLPVDRLRKALARASQPMVSRIEPHSPLDRSDNSPLLRVRGRNLVSGRPPRVSIGGEPVSLLKATDQELILAPLAHQMGGMLTVETGPEMRTETAFDLKPRDSQSSSAGGDA